MAFSKVTLNGDTLMDVTQKTVTAATMLSGTTALKNDGTDITGNIGTKTSANLSASGATVTAPAGYYASDASKSVATGSATTPATSITANPTISVDSSGLITSSVSTSQSVTPTVSAGYVSSGTAGTVSVSGSNTEQLSTQAAATITPTTSSQTAVAAGKYTIGAVTVTAIPSEYIVPSGTASLLTDGIHSVGAYAYANVDVADAISIQSTNIRISNHTLVIGIDVDYISASYVQTKIIYDSGISDLDDLRSDLTVTAYYNNTSEVVTDYTLFGTLNAGAQTIVVLYGNKIATFTTNVIAAKMSLSYTNGDLIKYGASISWDSTRHLFYTPSDAYRRRMFVVDYGVRSIKYNDGSTLSDSDFYPIPIPPNATEVTVSITPSTQYFGMPFYNLVNGEYERVQTFGWSQGSNTAQFEAGAYGFMSITTKYDSAGTTYPTEPTEFSIIFAE